MFQVKRLSPDATVPSKAKQGDGGWDLYTSKEVIAVKDAITVINTDIALAIPLGYVGFVKERSGLALRGVEIHGGVIDSGYRGEVKVIVKTHENITFPKGTKIAQLCIIKIYDGVLDLVEELDSTERGAAGFGSSG